MTASAADWDRAGAIRSFEAASRMNEALQKAPLADRSSKQYLQAIKKFQEVPLKDPHYSASDDAIYYLGKLYQELAEKTGKAEYAKSSVASYARMLEQYPGSPLRPDALLASGQVQLALLNNRSEADRLFRQVVVLFPGTAEAKGAKERLGEMQLNGEPVEAKRPSGTAPKASPSSEFSEPRPALPTSSGSRDLTRILGLKASKIVIDAGHGGHDSGTQSKGGFKEKELALDLALRLKHLVEQELGIAVVLTRDSDVFIPLEERTRIANQHKADLFISIHANFSSSAKISGVETYVLDFARSSSERDLATRENASSHRTIGDLEDLVRNIARKEKLQESRELANRVQKRLQAEMRKQNPASKNRGIKQAPFIVLIGASMPSILAEVAFLSNKRDADSLLQPKNRQAAAAALLGGIREYVGTLSAEASMPRKSGTR